MNEHIRELAVRCGAWNQVYNNKEFMVDRTFNVEQFANLLLQECIQICEEGTSTQTTSNGVAMLIKQRFGIEL
jgi:hypothetical protein